MPSTAWSIGASSKTMLAALPPNSKVSFLAVPATARWISLPTSVEPVNAILSTPGCATRARPVSPAPVMMLTTPGRQVGLLEDLGQVQRRQRRRLGRLEDAGVAGRQRRGQLPRRHQQREVPGDDLAGDPERLGVGPEAGVAQLVGPSGVVEEVGGGERHVDVAGLPDGLAVVERLEHGQLPGPLLEQPGDPVEVLGPLGRPHPAARPCRPPGGPRPRPGRRPPPRRPRTRPAPPRSPG